MLLSLHSIRPLISCVIPTANRPEMLRKAIACYRAQTYPNKELIILDDGQKPQPFEDVNQQDITYTYIGPQRKTIAAKRNLLCESAKGKIIAHFDDDDWSAPERLSTQFKYIIKGAPITGFHTIYFYNYADGKVYKYFNSFRYSLGTSLMFTRETWEGYRFNELMMTGSDVDFIDRLHTKPLYEAIDGRHLLVATEHIRSSNRKMFKADPFFEEVPFADLHVDFKNYLRVVDTGRKLGVGALECA